MRKYLALCVFALSLILLSCGSSPSLNSSTSLIDDETSGASVEESNDLNNVDPETIQASIVSHLILGGFLSDKLSYDHLPTLDDVDTSIKASSVSVPFDAEISDISDLIDLETIVIDSSGKYEKIKSANANGPVYYVAPISIVIDFENYSKQLSSSDNIIIDGKMSCSLNGHYTVETKKFLGEGACSTPSDENNPITVIFNGAELKVRLDARLTIHGMALDPNSFSPSGRITINDREFEIKDLPNQKPSLELISKPPSKLT